MTEAIVLRGKIQSYSVRREAANFFFTQTDQRALGMVAIGAAMVGASGPAMGTAISASEMEEEADHVEFSLDGKPVSGWVWRSPFAEGDEVEVVAEREGDRYAAVAITRPADRMIAMYPHLSRGRWSHFLNSLKWWLWGMTIFSVVNTLFMGTIWALDGADLFSKKVGYFFVVVNLIVFALMLLPTIHLTWRYMHFVKAAETVFRALGWENAGRIDLNKTSKAGRQGNEPPEYGTYYFRY